jgi:hypothetical protein
VSETATSATRTLPAEGPPKPAGETGARIAAAFALVLLAVTWSWWAWQEGAYFEVVLLPGAMLLCAGVAILAWVAPARASLRLGRPAVIAFVSLVGLGAWAGLSALWSPAPDIAIGDAQRVFVYALSFGLGAWMAILIGSRVSLCMIPLAVAGAFAGATVAVVLLTGDDPRDYLEIDGSLDFPLGYRNANAAFFAVALFPALGLAADRELDWRARAVFLATATLCLDAVILSESRGSMPAGLVALAVYALVSPLRLRAMCWLALAVIPAIGVVPAVTDLYRVVNDDGLGAAVNEMNAAGVAVLVTTGSAAVLGALAAGLERWLPGLGSTSARGNRAVLAGLVAVAAALAVAFVVRVGDPVDWIGDRAQEFGAGGTPDLSAEASRFTFNAGSNRSDVWRVALEDAREDPLLGDGGGGFQYSYSREREESLQNVHDAHSIELEVLSELGVPGLALLLAALASAAWGALRVRRLSPQAAGLAAIALTSGAYWLTHSSIDWFWAYPAITAPVLALLGSACGAGMRARDGHPGPPAGRRWIVAGAAVLAVSAVPPFLSERYVNDAYAGWRSDLTRAYDDLDRAQTLNPFSDTPLLAEGAIADAAGDRERALAAFREAAEDRPEEWATHYLLAELYADEQPALARRELEIARELNPLSPDVEELGRELGTPAQTQPE